MQARAFSRQLWCGEARFYGGSGGGQVTIDRTVASSAYGASYQLDRHPPMSPDVPWPREIFIDLAPDVRIRYGRIERPPISYAIVLETQLDGHWTAIRLWDNAHSIDDHHEHEYTSSQGKSDPTVQPFTTVNQAMAAAMRRATEDWPTILEDWRSR